MSRREHGAGHNGRVDVFLTVGAIKPSLAFLLRHAFSLFPNSLAQIAFVQTAYDGPSQLSGRVVPCARQGSAPQPRLLKRRRGQEQARVGGCRGAQWAATVFCRHCRSPEPLVCHWVAPGECLVEGNADPGAFPRTKDPLGSRSEATTHPFVS